MNLGLSRRPAAFLGVALMLAIAISLSCRDVPRDAPGREPAVGTIELTSDFSPLVDGFVWARQTALSYAHEGDSVGDWFEAALPGREAFCMRDVSHQVTGALALGLADHLQNMLQKFAVAIAESRDWCSYWEIDRNDRPAPVDYRSDSDFWYNLPANFDVVAACYRAYQWTGDDEYLERADFENFYRRSLRDYVEAWDPNGDGLMESPAEKGTRGLATYYEGEGPRAVTGGDLVAAQYAANLAYSRILAFRGRREEAAAFENEAARLRRLYNETWWDPALERFHPSIGPDGSFNRADIPSMQILPLYFGIVDEARAARLFETLSEGVNVEENSYLAEAHYRYGRDEEAFRFLLAQMDPKLPRREYPENPFTAVGTTVRYLVGVNPLASERVVETFSRLPRVVGWIRVAHLPLFQNRVTVRQISHHETRFENEAGPSLRWRAVFPGKYTSLLVDGDSLPATARPSPTGGVESYVTLDVEPGRVRVVRTPDAVR
jgi:Mannosylglycerate hydrolase MGH1-like glycoside hydrolase domain